MRKQPATRSALEQARLPGFVDHSETHRGGDKHLSQMFRGATAMDRNSTPQAEKGQRPPMAS